MHFETVVSENRDNNQIKRLSMLGVRTKCEINAYKAYGKGSFSTRKVEDLQVALKKIRHRTLKAMGL